MDLSARLGGALLVDFNLATLLLDWSKRLSANGLIIEKLSGDFMDSFEGYQVPEIDLGSRG